MLVLRTGGSTFLCKAAEVTAKGRASKVMRARIAVGLTQQWPAHDETGGSQKQRKLQLRLPVVTSATMQKSSKAVAIIAKPDRDDSTITAQDWQ